MTDEIYIPLMVYDTQIWHGYSNGCGYGLFGFYMQVEHQALSDTVTLLIKQMIVMCCLNLVTKRKKKSPDASLLIYMGIID